MKRFLRSRKCVLSSLVLVFFLVALFFIVSSLSFRKDSLEKYFTNLPSTFRIIEYGGCDSPGGANRYIVFEISPSDLSKFILENSFIRIEEELQGNREFSFIDRFGKQQTIDSSIYETEKSGARRMGIIADKVYIRDDSVFSHYSILIVNKEKTRIYFKYYRV